MNPSNDLVLGWQENGTITALIIYYADVDDWSLCPRADAPESSWPPFTGDESFGDRLREYSGTGNPVDLTSMLADSQNLVFWVPAAEELGGAVIAVELDLPAEPDAYVLPHGRYVYYKALRSGAAIPSLADLLADEHRVDLGPRLKAVRLNA